MKLFWNVMLVLVFALGAVAADAKQWRVPQDFATIQAAIDSADVSNGDRIVVASGNHAGAVVSKAVEIKGQGGAVIDDGPLLAAGHPLGGDLNIGFFFVGDGTGSGASISHFHFEGVEFPVFSRGADDVSVNQCTMIDAVQAVSNWSGSRWEISHNTITGLRTINGGGIGILIGENTGGIIMDNVVSHNTISGTLQVHPDDGGGYNGSGIVIFAEFRFGRPGAEAISFNRIVKNKIALASDTPNVVDVAAIELTDPRDDNSLDPVITNNAVGFNDMRGTDLQLVLTPSNLDNPTNDISRNLGENRGQGLHPSAFLGD